MNLISNVAEMRDNPVEVRDNQAELLCRLKRLEKVPFIDSASQKRFPDHSHRMVAEYSLATALPLVVPLKNKKVYK